MTLREINKTLKGKVSKEERYFKCFIAHLINTEGIQSLYNKKMFCDYLIIIGEKDGGKMFNFLKQRRDEFLEETKDIILRQLITDHTTDKVLREHYVDKQTLNTQEKIKTSLSFLN